ncbi:MAG TPA: TonB family protein [Terriglobia bacterium]|nr:TonB family protein [Terriglobia bacterium]
MDSEPSLNLLLELETEVTRWRRRTMFLLSIMFHILLFLLLIVSPSLFQRGEALLGIKPQPQPKQETTFLLLPPDVLKRLEMPPKTNILSDKNRLARGRAPKINPKALPMPYMKGNSRMPEVAGGGSPKPKPAPPAPQPHPQSPPPGQQTQAQVQRPTPPTQQQSEQSKLRLEDVQTPKPQTNTLARAMGMSTPEEVMRQTMQGAAQNRAVRGVPGMGDSPAQFNNPSSNFSTEGPIILSDTRGVDFGPYLARILMIVKQNWYAVIPESARLGEKGRTAIVFEILKDGSVPQVRLVGASGHLPLDRAALASIRASIPFPPLPQEFTGRHLVLQFNFLYNLGYSQ